MKKGETREKYLCVRRVRVRHLSTYTTGPNTLERLLSLCTLSALPLPPPHRLVDHFCLSRSAVFLPVGMLYSERVQRNIPWMRFAVLFRFARSYDEFAPFALPRSLAQRVVFLCARTLAHGIFSARSLTLARRSRRLGPLFVRQGRTRAGPSVRPKNPFSIVTVAYIFLLKKKKLNEIFGQDSD